MGDKKFTLVELHVDGTPQIGLGSIGEALPIGRTESAMETEGESDREESGAADEESGGKGKSAVGAILALVVLAGIAVAAKKFRGDEEESEFETEEEPDVIVN